MRIPRARFTIRWLMIGIAITGAVLALAVECRRRHDRFLSLAAHHLACIHIVNTACNLSQTQINEYGEDVRRRSNAWIRWHREMAMKYRRAAARPWLPVEPDAPEPRP
ncbi:MAG: hypothetical protein ACYC61_15370 [Isosphaeraceae bacterium]